MRVRALDPTTLDWNFGKGKGSYLRDIDALKQNISTRIKSWKGNCFFALQDHVDWQNWFEIGSKTFLDLDIKRVIIQTNGIIRLNSYTSEIVGREIWITAHFSSIFGSDSIAL